MGELQLIAGHVETRLAGLPIPRRMRERSGRLEMISAFRDGKRIEIHELAGIGKTGLQAVEFFSQLEHPTEGTLNVARFPVRFSASPANTRRLSPNIGEHNDEFIKPAIEEAFAV